MKKIILLQWLTVALCFLSANIQAQPVVITPLHVFTNNPDGAEPVSLVLSQTDGALYGITFGGGSSGYGSIYKINRDGSNYRQLHAFSSSETGDAAGGFGGYANIGFSLLQGSDGALYGTTEYGGTNGDGTVFRLSNDGNFFTVLHSFGASDPSPLNLMQGSDGVLYGSGISDVFALNTDGGNYRVLHNLASASEGSAAYGRLLQTSDGSLFGTAVLGGTNNGGTLFKLDTNGNFSVLHAFSPLDGTLPWASLIQGNDGALYGTTSAGGTNSHGTIFKLDTNGGNFQVLYSFGQGTNDGVKPYGGLVQGLGGILFGSTESGGANGTGTLFKISPDGSGYNVLFSFGFAGIGNKPYAALVAGASSDASGVLYGTTTEQSGNNNNGPGGIFAMLVNPPLTITPVSNQSGSNQTVLFWPQWAFNYTLQMTTNPASTNWITISNAVPVTGVQLTNSVPAAFYRLIYQ